MTKTSRVSGFLLLEALIAISLFAIGVLALAESFASVTSASHLYERKKAMADCAQNKILQALVGLETDSAPCAEQISWTIEQRILSSQSEAITFTGSLKNPNGKKNDEQFEIVRLTNKRILLD